MESKLKILPNGTKVWRLSGGYHREDGPAIEWLDGTKIWYLNNNLHRENGPAMERPDGAKYWYLNGQLHREDGPAVKWPNNTKYWYLNGNKLYEKELLSEKIKIDYPDLYNSYVVHQIMES